METENHCSVVGCCVCVFLCDSVFVWVRRQYWATYPKMLSKGVPTVDFMFEGQIYVQGTNALSCGIGFNRELSHFGRLKRNIPISCSGVLFSFWVLLLIMQVILSRNVCLKRGVNKCQKQKFLCCWIPCCLFLHYIGSLPVVPQLVTGTLPTMLPVATHQVLKNFAFLRYLVHYMHMMFLLT